MQCFKFNRYNKLCKFDRPSVRGRSRSPIFIHLAEPFSFFRWVNSTVVLLAVHEKALRTKRIGT